MIAAESPTFHNPYEVAQRRFTSDVGLAAGFGDKILQGKPHSLSAAVSTVSIPTTPGLRPVQGLYCPANM